jgi:hypothetical protein
MLKVLDSQPTLLVGFKEEPMLVISSPCLNLPLLAANKAGKVLSRVDNGRHLVATCQQVHEFQLVQPQFWETQALSVLARKSGNSLLSVLWIRDFSRPEIWIRPL